MNRTALASEIERLRPILCDVIGFHELAENESISLTPLQRTVYEARVYAAGVELGSGLIDQSQKMTVAAMQMAEKKVWEHRS